MRWPWPTESGVYTIATSSPPTRSGSPRWTARRARFVDTAPRLGTSSRRSRARPAGRRDLAAARPLAMLARHEPGRPIEASTLRDVARVSVPAHGSAALASFRIRGGWRPFLVVELAPGARTLNPGDRDARDGRHGDPRPPRAARRRAGGGAAARGARPADAGGARPGPQARPHDGRSARQGAHHRARGPGLPEPSPRAHRRPARLSPRALRGAAVHGLVGARGAPARRGHGALSAEPGRPAHRQPAAPRDAERDPARRGGRPAAVPRGATPRGHAAQSQPARRGDPRRG